MPRELIRHEIAKGESVVCFWSGSIIVVEHRHGGRRTMIGRMGDLVAANHIAVEFVHKRKQELAMTHITKLPAAGGQSA